MLMARSFTSIRRLSGFPAFPARKPWSEIRIFKSGKHDAAFYQQMWETLRRGEVWRGRISSTNTKTDGFTKKSATISPVRDAAGKIVNYMAIKLDITREVELEAQFRQAQKLDSIGQLAGGVAHDFNNILSAMMMQTESAAACPKT